MTVLDVLYRYEVSRGLFATAELLVIILSLLQTEIIYPQKCNWICHCTYSLLLHYLENATTYTSSGKLLNKSAMHAIILLLLRSRKFWWYLVIFDDASRRHHDDVIVTSFSFDLFTVPVNLVYVWLYGSATKIRFWSKERTWVTAPKKPMKEFTE